MKRLLPLAVLWLAGCASQHTSAEFPAGSCGFARLDSSHIITARHCLTGETELPLQSFRNDWIILARKGDEPASDILPLEYTDLLRLPAGSISFADQSNCTALATPLGAGAFLLDCSAKPGDSGSGVFVFLSSKYYLVGVISGFTTEGNAIVTSATQFAPPSEGLSK